jgi:hypothetical protein
MFGMRLEEKGRDGKGREGKGREESGCVASS